MTRRWMIAAMGLCVLAAGSVGCVSKDEYDRVVAAARRANEELDKCQSAADGLRVENQRLREALTSGGADAARIAKLESEKGKLQTALDELYVKYKKLVDRDLPIGTISILPAQINAALMALANQNGDLVEYMPKYGMLKLKSDLTFGKGKADVTADAKPALKKLAQIMNEDEAKIFHIYIAGHTDDIPLKNPATIKAHGSNWGLSSHRALAVVKELFSAGVEQKRMGAMGFSRYHPVAANKAGRKGNPVNRRVEIWIIPQDKFLTINGD